MTPAQNAKCHEDCMHSRAEGVPDGGKLAVDLILRHSEHFKALKPQSVEMRTLTSLVEKRRTLVNDRVRITNRLRYALKQYYPQVLEWFEHIDTVLFCEFIERWPTLKQAKRARKNTLRTFFSAHNMRFAHVVERRVRAIKEALPLTSDEAVIIPHRLQALIFVEQLRVTLKAIKRYVE